MLNKRMELWIQEELKEAAKQEAKKLDISLSEFCRICISIAVDQPEDFADVVEFYKLKNDEVIKND